MPGKQLSDEEAAKTVIAGASIASSVAASHLAIALDIAVIQINPVPLRDS